MLFNSYVFLFGFLPIVLAGFVLLRRQTWRLAFIVIASYGFYAYDQWWFPALMAGSTAISFAGGLALDATRGTRQRKQVLALAVGGCLSLLVFFKYAQFAAHSAASVATVLTSRGLPSVEAFTDRIALPIGISFFTFEAISYLVDVYRRDLRPERNLLRYAFFISFFPHLVAGPIVRYAKLAPQLRTRYRLNMDLFVSGLLLVSLGLAKKVLLADGIAARTDPLLASPGSLGFVTAWTAMLGYSFQIYFDFSGYCDIALGLARMFGIELPWNFDRPYRAANPSEFWRRWHVTLSSWLRDYLYIPLGGNRKGERRRDANLLVTMGLGGLWHGASITFAIWGLYHGLLLAGHRRVQRLGPLPRPLAVLLTFVLVTVGWVFFRMHDAAEIGAVLAAMAGLRGFGSVTMPLVPFLLVAAVLMWGVQEEWRWRLPTWGVVRVASVGAVAGLTLVFMNHAHTFIYFKF